MRSSPSLILLILFAGILCLQGPAQSQSLVVERRGDSLHLAAPQMHFLEGKPLDKLHNGAALTYVITVTAGAEHGGAPAYRLQGRFIVSFDLWEEKFSVIQSGPNGRTVSRLSATQAEAWCLENMSLPVQAIPAQKSFVVRLECSIAEDEGESSVEGRSGLTLAGLIEVFSRKRGEAPLQWQAVSVPLRLGDLKSPDKSAR